MLIARIRIDCIIKDVQEGEAKAGRRVLAVLSVNYDFEVFLSKLEVLNIPVIFIECIRNPCLTFKLPSILLASTAALSR
jgi:hypothetical protein